jgi:glycosyltransferase involved in cell wall biosynthesis
LAAVSIVLPTWNAAELLRQAVASVSSQTFDDWELIIIDDGSTDDTLSILRDLGDNRIRVIHSAHTGNPAILRNRAIEAASADIIAFIDSDDLWEPDKLEVQLRAFTSEYGWSYTNTFVIDEAGRDITATVEMWQPFSDYILEPLLRLDARVSASTVMIRRDVIMGAGGFDAKCPVEDYDLWIRIAPGHRAIAVERALSHTRSRPDSYQSDRAMAHRGWQQIYGRVHSSSDDSRIRTLCGLRAHRHRLSEAAYLARAGRRFDAAQLLVRSVGPALRYRAGWKVFWSTAGQVLRP